MIILILLGIFISLLDSISFVEEIITVEFLSSVLGSCVILVPQTKFSFFLYIFLAWKFLLGGLFHFYCAKSL